jgi:exodeoxyribonuclease VII small subunit
MAKAKKEVTFEKDLETLEEIVTALEEGGLSLDESLKRFEEGITLAGRCEKALSSAEKKIEILTKNAAGKMEAKPFNDSDGEISEDGNQNASDGLPPEPDEDEDDDGALLF